MKKIVVTTLMALLSVIAFSQSGKLSYANKLYSNLEYLKASEVYTEIVEKDVKRGDLDYKTVANCAESFYRIREYEKSLFYYQKIDDKLIEQDYELMLDCYLRVNKWEEAKKLSKKYPNFNTYPRSKYVSSENKNMLLQDSSNYHITKLVTINSAMGDFCPFVTNEGIYFTSNRKQLGYTNSIYKYDESYYCKTYFAKKETSYDFKNVEIVNELNSKFHDGAVSISKDGKRLIVTRNDLSEAKNKSKQMLFIVEYERINGKWTNPKAFPFNSETYNVGHAVYSEDGNTIFFSSDMPGGYGGSDIYKSTREGESWSKPINLGSKVNSPKDELFPFISNTGDIYFSSNGYQGVGGLDIYKFEKTSGKVINLGYPINTISDDFGFVLDDNIGYFSSDRENGIDNIYAVLIKPVKGVLLIDVYANKQKTTEAETFLVDKNTGDTMRVYPNELGQYKVEVEKNHEYDIVSKMDKYYQSNPVVFDTKNMRPNEEVTKRVDLESDYVDVNILALDKLSKKPIPFATGIFEAPDGTKTNFITDSLGRASIKLVEDKTYSIDASKKGYLPYSDEIYIQKDVVVELNLPMQEIKKNMKFEVKNILYDFAKWDLREESTVELDKLAEFLIGNDIKVELSSHTDCRGSDQKNDLLSQKRAESCVKYLIAKGVNPKNIIAKGYGERQLLNKCDDGVNCSEEEHQANRRTEIKILAVLE